MANSKNMLKYLIFTCKIRFVENVFRQKLIKNDAGEARNPSRKMRLEKSCKQRPESIRNDIYGASYGRFTETYFCNIYIDIKLRNNDCTVKITVHCSELFSYYLGMKRLFTNSSSRRLQCYTLPRLRIRS